MTPGPDLDALVAEKVMGWTLRHPGEKERSYWEDEKGRVIWWQTTFCPSVDIYMAWRVVDKIKDLKGELCLSYKDKWTVFPTWHADSWAEAVSASTAPHAICLAALKACGVTQPEPVA